MKINIFIITIILTTSCRKDNSVLPNICTSNDTSIIMPPCIGNYNDYSDTFSYEKKSYGVIVDPGYTYILSSNYKYGEPIFNPNNPYEIIYGRIDQHANEYLGDIWKFSFCTGENTKLVDNFAYSDLDWSSKGWISFNAWGGLMYKIKDNGDSLTLLPQVDAYIIRWNPSGNLFTSKNKVFNENGVPIFQLNSSNGAAVDWLNDTTLLAIYQSKLYSLSIIDYSFNLLNNKWCHSFDIKTVDRENKICYVFRPHMLTSYSLNGDNTIDTILRFYDSYRFNQSDYSEGKIVTQFTRQHWDSTIHVDQVYYKSDILIMDADGTNQRIVNLP